MGGNCKLRPFLFFSWLVLVSKMNILEFPDRLKVFIVMHLHGGGNAVAAVGGLRADMSRTVAPNGWDM